MGGALVRLQQGHMKNIVNSARGRKRKLVRHSPHAFSDAEGTKKLRRQLVEHSTIDRELAIRMETKPNPLTYRELNMAFLFIRSEFLMSSGELPTEEGHRVIVLVQDGSDSYTRSITFDDERL
nr:hypothetical protein Iba_chr12cCG14770 [Ipomoea batatas]